MSAIAGVLTVGGLGVVFAGVAGSKLIQARRLRGNGVAARGTVVGRFSSPSPGGAGTGLRHHPEIVFTTAEGRTMRVTSPAGTSESVLLPGHTVTVYYDPADPAKVSIPDEETAPYRIILAAGLVMLLGLLAWAVLRDRLFAAMPFGIPLLLGGVFTGIGYFAVRRTWRIKHGGAADGVVVGSLAAEDRQGLTLHHPVVRYADTSGRTFEVASTVGHMGRPPAPGTPVRVHYDRADPQRMMLSHQGTPPVLWLFGVLGVILLVVAVIILAASVF